MASLALGVAAAEYRIATRQRWRKAKSRCCAAQHRQCRSIPVCLYVPVSAGIAVEWVSNLGSWRCSMCKQVLDHQISKSSPLCTRLTRHRAKRQKNLITCRDSALLSKRFVVRRLLKTCRVATAEDTHSLEQITNIFQLAGLQPSELPTSVSSIFSFALGTADCHVTPQLIQKFGEDKRRWQESRKVYAYVVAQLASLPQGYQRRLHKHRQWSV